MQVGPTKDQGLCNKPSVAVHPGALAAGTLRQYNKINVVESVHCAVRTDSLYTADYVMSLKG